MRYRIGVCDDEVSTCSELENYIMSYFKDCAESVEVYVWTSAEAFMQDVPDKANVDILFLDIELPGENGTAVGRYIREKLGNDSMHIIYISSKTSYAMELFETHPYNFLVKPFDMERVCCELHKLLRLDRLDRRFFSYTYNKLQYKILVGDIIYFKCDKHHIKIVCKTGEKEYVGKLKSELEKLPDNFAMINQSNIINIRHIRECSGTDVLMDNGEKLPISKNYREKFNEKMMENSRWGELKNECV